jgi:hypothetical protein
MIDDTWSNILPIFNPDIHWDIYDQQKQYVQNYLWELWKVYDKETQAWIDKFFQSQQDTETSMNYYRQDFENITSRKTQDYFTWIALRDKEFSKSLDYVANIAQKTVGTLEWLWKNRIVEATWDKMESDIRYKLDFNRTMDDLENQKNQLAHHKRNATKHFHRRQ